MRAVIGWALALVAGALVLRRTIGPLSVVESQLRRLAADPSAGEGQLQTLPATGQAAIGWNRLVKLAGDQDRPGSLEGRLDRALENFRQNKQEQILNGLADGVAVTDDAGRITFANRAFAGLLGMETSEANSGQETIQEVVSKLRFGHFVDRGRTTCGRGDQSALADQFVPDCLFDPVRDLR